jgi:hypothetical protein
LDAILNHYRELLGVLEPVQVLTAFCLLSVGLISGPPVLRRGIRPLCAYPLWVLGRIERLLRHTPGFPALFGLILSLNSASLLLNLLSGFTVLLPALFALLLGLNLGVILARMSGGSVLLPLLLNPVAWLEIPAATVSLAGGIRIGSIMGGAYTAANLKASLVWAVNLYLWFILPLLLTAALLESFLIARTGAVRLGDGPPNGPGEVGTDGGDNLWS